MFLLFALWILLSTSFGIDIICRRASVDVLTTSPKPIDVYQLRDQVVTLMPAESVRAKINPYRLSWYYNNTNGQETEFLSASTNIQFTRFYRQIRITMNNKSDAIQIRYREAEVPSMTSAWATIHIGKIPLITISTVKNPRDSIVVAENGFLDICFQVVGLPLPRVSFYRLTGAAVDPNRYTIRGHCLNFGPVRQKDAGKVSLQASNCFGVSTVFFNLVVSRYAITTTPSPSLFIPSTSSPSTATPFTETPSTAATSMATPSTATPSTETPTTKTPSTPPLTLTPSATRRTARPYYTRSPFTVKPVVVPHVHPSVMATYHVSDTSSISSTNNNNLHLNGQSIATSPRLSSAVSSTQTSPEVNKANFPVWGYFAAAIAMLILILLIIICLVIFLKLRKNGCGNNGIARVKSDNWVEEPVKKERVYHEMQPTIRNVQKSRKGHYANQEAVVQHEANMKKQQIELTGYMNITNRIATAKIPSDDTGSYAYATTTNKTLCNDKSSIQDNVVYDTPFDDNQTGSLWADSPTDINAATPERSYSRVAKDLKRSKQKLVYSELSKDEQQLTPPPARPWNPTQYASIDIK